MRNSYLGELTAEFLGTGMLVLFGNAALATNFLFGAYGGVMQVGIAWGLTLMLAVYMFGGVSGGHFNPAVTLAVGTFRGFPKSKILPYWLAQLVGGFAASALLHLMIGSKLVAFEAAQKITRGMAGSEATAKIFATYPGADVSILSAFLIEVVLTMVLVLVVMTITDNRQENATAKGFGPAIVGLTLTLLVGVGGPWTMTSANPARDLGPRLWAFVAGWGSIALPGPDAYFWVPVIAPLVGGLVAGVIYERLVRPYLPQAASGRKTA